FLNINLNSSDKKEIKQDKKYDIGIMVRVPDASGVLTGKVNEDTIFKENDHRSYRKKEWIIEAMKKIDKIKPIANSRGWNIAQLAIKFILSKEPISTVIPTVVDIEELESFVEMSDGKYLNRSELNQIEEMYENNFYVNSVIHN
ncbi:MAG: aldo/keto reductase, partial [Nitrososphaeraceae archaeon]|nr:aldo/keto reductase [Nitrososphaeraceae archaeon]